jgi:raffinose/stachyose/melibiose transport system permease protein
MLPVVILNKSKYYQTLALFQYMFNDPYNFQYNLGFASYLVGMIPLLIAYLVAQKKIVGGLTTGAIKG